MEITQAKTNVRQYTDDCAEIKAHKQFRVLTVDDHHVVRAGLTQLLSTCPDVAEIDEAIDGQQALQKVREKDWGVVILDISMPGDNGLKVLKQIKSERPGLAVLMLSMHAEDQYALRALKSGASGYLNKSCLPEEIIEAVIKVAKGGKYITLALAEKLANALDPHVVEARHELLSNRELQIFQELARGKSVSQIGKELSLSTKTVSTHRANILKKMNLKNNAELMFYAIDNGLISRGSIT